MTLEVTTLSEIEELARIVKNYRLESLKIGDIEIKKVLHDPVFIASGESKKTQKPKTLEEEEDELLFYSAIPGR